jgi:hypothetical protein
LILGECSYFSEIEDRPGLTHLRTRFYSAARKRVGIANTYEPLEGIERDDSDITIIALTSTVKYTKPVYDPWFLALKETILYDTTQRKNETYYLPNSPYRAMGCIAQVVFHTF